MTRQVIERDKLGVLTKIAQGGQGVVFRAPNVKTRFAPSMVYKEYKAQTLAGIDFSALAAMPALVEDSLSYAQAEHLVSIAAWPCALIENAGQRTGFVMPAIPDEFFVPLTTVKGVSSSIAEFAHLLNHPSVLVARGIDLNDAQRYSLLREVAAGLAFLHMHGVCVGDISPKNLLFSLRPHPGVYFIDCDAMRINGVSALRQMETPDWEVPAGEELATMYSDTYKLGLLALRLIAGSHDTKNLGHIPATTPPMLRQLITDTISKAPQQRPLPVAWGAVLGNAIEQAQHQQKTAVPTLAGVPPVAPPTPVVHSRPSGQPSAPRSTPTSRPPVPAAAEVATRSTLPNAASETQRNRRRTVVAVTGGVVAIVAVIAAALGIRLLAQDRPHHHYHQLERAYGSQITLPFTGLQIASYAPSNNVALDAAGNIYVVDGINNRVVMLEAGPRHAETVLPFELNVPNGVAVDAAGNVYVTDTNGNRVVELAAGSATPTVLPFADLDAPLAVAVDAAGNVYITNQEQVLKLAAGSATPTVIPFTGLRTPSGVAVDAAGDLYVTDRDNNRVVEMPAGSSTQTVLPFTGLSEPIGVTVDAAGAVYVTDMQNNRVLKLAAGSATPTALPFTGLNQPAGVAADTAGNLYVTDMSNDRVVKLPMQ